MTEADNAKKPWARRKMRGGRWQDPKDGSAAPQRADRPISVKLTEAELHEFDGQIARLGLKRNRALRIAARRIGGFIELDPASSDALKDIARQITGIARNVNQIARAANRTRDPAYHAFMEERQRLGKELARAEAVLQSVLEVSRRRSDGLARLEEASE